MLRVIATHKTTDVMYESSPMVVGGINFNPNKETLISMAIDMWRRDNIIDIVCIEDYRFDVKTYELTFLN